MTIDTRRKTCNCCNQCDILSVYLSHGKGGQYACYGEILNSRGGRPGTSSEYGHGVTLDTPQGTASVQVWRGLSHHARRLRAVPNHSQNHTREEKSGKLTVFSLSASVRDTPIVSQALSASLIPHCLDFIIAHEQGSVRKAMPMNIPICQWCHYSERRPAPFLYGSIPLCARCYRYASESDRDTRKRLDAPVVLPRKRVRWAA